MKNQIKPIAFGAGCKFLILGILIFFKIELIAAQSHAYNVLYLNSYNIGYAWSDSIAKGVRKSLNRKDVKLFTECLDAKRFGQENFKVFSEYLRKKYHSLRFDAVITSDNDALDFMFGPGKILFPGIPVVFCGISNPEDYNFEGTQFYGFTESNNPRQTVSLLTKLMPDAKSMLLITDNTTSGNLVSRDIEKLNSSVKITIISEVDVDETLNLVRSGKHGDIVFVTAINRDKYGNLLDYIDLFVKIAEVSPKPVFANDELVFGNGIVGGNANRGFTQGFQSGVMTMQLLSDTTRAAIPHVSDVNDEYIFDYRLIKKFGINTANLPEGSVVINKPITQYLKYIILLSVVVVLLSAIIIMLTIINRRRLLAEKKVSEQLSVINDRNLELEQSYTQLSELNCELEEANAQLQSLNRSLEEAKLKAEESEKLKSSFLANLSHEIRTPLNAILGFSSLLCDQNLTNPTREYYFKIIQSNSDSLLVLIDDILDFSKIEAGQIHIHKEPVEINRLMEELCEQFGQKYKNDVQLRLAKAVSDNKLILYTDKIRFKQILTNLLTNAFKFTEEGYIEVGFEIQQNGAIRFFVKDTGIGIDKKYHQAIFERFRKLEDEHSKFYSGSGLGLAICKKLTELLGGNIWVEGEPGKGSTFYFTHPDYQIMEPPAPAPLNGKQGNRYKWQGYTIAVAEDEDNNYLLLEQIITHHGAKLIRFRDGVSIVQYFSEKQKHDIKLILMDIKMPGMDGVRALEKIRHLFPEMVVIAQTAYAMSDDIKLFREKGFDDYISKPINVEVLREKLDKFLLS